MELSCHQPGVYKFLKTLDFYDDDDDDDDNDDDNKKY